MPYKFHAVKRYKFHDFKRLSFRYLFSKIVLLTRSISIGNLRCDGQNFGVQVQTYATELFSECKPIEYEQDDEYFTDNNSQCTLRLRADSARNIVYSQPFGFKITLWDNLQLNFVFPSHKKAEVEFCFDKFFYQNCNCRQIVGCGGDVDNQTRAATTLRKDAPVMPTNTVV